MNNTDYVKIISEQQDFINKLMAELHDAHEFILNNLDSFISDNEKTE